MEPDNVQEILHNLYNHLNFLKKFYTLLKNTTQKGDLTRTTFIIRTLLAETKALDKLEKNNQQNLTPKLLSSVRTYISLQSILNEIFKQAESWEKAPAEERLAGKKSLIRLIQMNIKEFLDGNSIQSEKSKKYKKHKKYKKRTPHHMRPTASSNHIQLFNVLKISDERHSQARKNLLRKQLETRDPRHQYRH